MGAGGACQGNSAAGAPREVQQPTASGQDAAGEHNAQQPQQSQQSQDEDTSLPVK